MDTISVMILF